MNKNNKHKLIPKLRFPEFQNAGEWEVKKVGDILVESKIPLKINDLEKRITVRLNLKGVEKREYRGTESENATYFFERKKGQFIYGKQNLHKGAFGIIPEELDGYASSQDLPAFDFQNGFFPKFFLHYLSQETVYPELEKIATGTGSKRIHPKEFYNVSIPVPSLPEQQKIASCLSSLDEVITGEQQKLELLKQHKKGLLQNLFPQEGETVPKLRFKEFENSGEWEVKKLIQIATYVNDKMPIENLSINSYISTENLLADYAGVTLASKLPSSGNFTKYQKGDILVSNIRPYLKKVWFADKDGACSNDVIVIRSGTFVSDKLLSYLLKNDAFISYIMKGAEGVKMPRGDKDSIKEYPILYPKDKTEQQKIASCLSSLDDLITAQTQKIEQLQRHKKGLLQGLFPNMNEHHG